MDEIPGYSFIVPAVQQEIRDAMANAVNYLDEVCHCKISDYKFRELNASCEISLIKYSEVKELPNIFKNSKDPEVQIHWN